MNEYIEVIGKLSNAIEKMIEAGYSKEEIREHLELALKAHG